ncbi:O-antigen ligase family protein [Anaerorhabdus furcosa]|uniref:O-antigen ligase like membrane protein n=1 Tax=Anaerorhabdus furcosa TaxID=118967 RepID=A0A1T4LVL0_9FIRM|nr:O-antigen ligase family protein [Anaerorhabdus furcosa]SJZ58779.1 hypothetical protein SAMN02745191_1064 [Anaerorhabdus furcosa]
MKKLFNEKNLSIAIILLIALQPIIDMDYLAYEFLDQFGLPRLSTIIRFLIIPGLILWTFFLKEKNKKKVITVVLIYGALLGGYFVLHCMSASQAYNIMGFTTNFKFSWYQELIYILTLILPFGITYCVYNMNFSETVIKKIVYFLSSIISIPIFLGDLFVFGKSTYFGYTVANFFTWFTGIYEQYHPRELASKFFFNEGNTIGILLFMILPLMYYFFTKENNKKTKIMVGVLIGIQSLSMQILATRVATYGAIIIPIIFLVLYLFDALIMKNQKIMKNVVILCICFAGLFGAILDFTPAVQNQKVDAENTVALIDNGAVHEGKKGLKGGVGLVPGSTEFNNFYIHMFREYGINAKYISSVPSMYYIDWYNYNYDPKFWVDVTFMDVYDRVNGRQIQTIFMNYKLDKLNTYQKIMGAGYSTFMNGSIILEQDFKQQWMTLGPIGSFLTIFPWIASLLVGAFLVVKKWKQLFKLDIFVYAMSFVAALGTAYMSGHTLDQFISTTFMALLLGTLFCKIKEAYDKKN